jgi:beta-1,2-mannobiose phosphorylase / 1,2-beta-oligomannan phosphorylase
MLLNFLVSGFLSLVLFLTAFSQKESKSNAPKMMYGDTSRIGIPFAKDPFVIKFQGRYLMYYSIPPYKDLSNPVQGWGLGIAESRDLNEWNRIGEIIPDGEYEKKGLAAPCALIINKQVNLFYQTYGNGKNDAICHAVSSDGIHFNRNPTNPIFHPTGNWNCGRAIDAEVIRFKDNYLLYFATRDPDYKIQMQGVASASAGTNFNRGQWTQLTDYPIMKPEYPWEGACIEAASVVQQSNLLYMFYAGAYNNYPQQIGVAKSSDGIKWERVSDKPFLKNGSPGEWNHSESGHPHLFRDEDGKTYLFYQGNNDNGKTWYISKVEIHWNEKGPYIDESMVVPMMYQ